ncbi:MAG: hypothetical protein U1E73_06045 [Planctomycetota bacterium]
METTTPFASIARIHALLDDWRELGSRTLPDGVELMGCQENDCAENWLHVVHPGLSTQALNAFERRLRLRLPRDLRALYRRSSGMTLWGGAFIVYGYHDKSPLHTQTGFRPGDALRLNHELEVLGWKPANAFAFAENAWDMTVHVVGMAHNPTVVQRCDRVTGAVLEEHKSVWTCIADRLSRIDNLMIAEPGADAGQQYSNAQTTTPVTET